MTNPDGTVRRTRVSDRSQPKEVYYTCFDGHCVGAKGEPVEKFVERVVLKRLANKKVIERLRATPDTAPVQEEIADLRRRREDLADLVADGLIARREAREKLERIAERMERAQVRLTSMRRESPLTDLALAESIPARWKKMGVLDKRRVIADLGMKMTLLSAPKKSARRDESGEPLSADLLAAKRVDIDWIDTDAA